MAHISQRMKTLLYFAFSLMCIRLNARTTFIQNQGQLLNSNGAPIPEVVFYTQTNPALYITRTGIWYVVREEIPGNITSSPISNAEDRPADVRFFRTDMQFSGTNPGSVAEGGHTGDGVFNFYYPHCSGGVTNVPEYQDIWIRDLYPGIDWHIYTVNENLKYDFVVHPGADPAQIRFYYQGDLGNRILPDGRIELTVGQSLIVEDAPVTYQVSGGVQVPVSSQFQSGSGEYGYAIGVFNPTQDLIIDPTLTLAYSTFFGGTLNERIGSVCHDGANNIWLYGGTENSTIPATAGAYQMANAGAADAILAKFNNSGTRLYTTYFGGTANDNDFAMTTLDISVACDAADNVWVIGFTASSNLPVTAGCHQPTFGGVQDVFVAKFSSGGTRLYATYYGGTGDDCYRDARLATDGSNVFILGNTQSATAIATAGSFQPALAGSWDYFVVKFDNAGVRQWGTYYGGTSSEQPDYSSGLACDGSGNVWFSGNTMSTNFPVTAGAFQTTLAGGTDNVLVKLSGTGARLYSTFYGSTGTEYWTAVGVDPSGNVWLYNSTTGSISTTAGAYQPVNGGGVHDGHLSKWSSTGTRLMATYCGGNGGEEAWTMDFDGAGNIWISGGHWSSNYPTLTPWQAVFGGWSDGMLTSFTPAGALYYSTHIGRSSYDESHSMCIDNLGNIWLGGYTSSTDFPVTAGCYQPTFGGSNDAFLMKFVPSIVLDNNAILLNAQRLMNRNVVLTWESPVTTGSWTLEHSTDGLSFQSVSSMSDPATRQCTDAVNLTPGRHYYRIGNRNTNGETTWSATVEVLQPETMNWISIYPSPVTIHGIVTIDFSGQCQGTAVFRLFDHTGKNVLQQNIQISSGRNKELLKLDELPAGNYSWVATGPEGLWQGGSLIIQ